MINGKPMLWCGELGHMAYDDLVYESGWEEGDSHIKFWERWTKNGVEVKSNAHVYIKRGIESQAVQEKM